MGEEFSAAAMVKELRKLFATGKTKSAEWRLEQIAGLTRFVTEKRDDFVDALKKDLGRPRPGAIAEIEGFLRAARGAAEQLEQWMVPEKVTLPVRPYANSAIIPEPLGVVLIIAPWNYPLMLSLDPLLGAVAAGNAVVLKPSEIAPATSTILAKFLPLYLDPAAVRVVEGGIAESTALLEQRWDKIFYTGSTRIGRVVMAAAAKHLTPVILELGGKSPTIVDSTADLDVVAKRISMIKWAVNYGQICVAPDYVLAEESVASELVKKIKHTIEQFFGEDPSTSPDIARVVNASHFKRLTGLLHDEKTAEKVVYGGELNEKTLYIAPTVILDPPLDSPVMQEEIFGPLLVVITVKNVDAAIGIINSREKPLALYVFSTDEKVVDKVLHETSSGGVTVNDVMTHVRHPSLPFGGVGESGMGSYHGKHSFLAFSHLKSVNFQKLTEDNLIPYPPYTKVQ